MEYPSDEAIMSAIQGGDFELLGVLFERYSAKAFGRCFQLVGDRTESDDLVQDAFLRVLRYRSSFKADARFSSWLYRIVTNVCIDHLKARGREAANQQALAAEPAPDWTPAEPSPRQQVVREALSRLPEDKRQLLVKIRVFGLGYAELAGETGASEGAIRVRVHRAMLELRSIVDSMSGEAR